MYYWGGVVTPPVLYQPFGCLTQYYNPNPNPKSLIGQLKSELQPPVQFPASHQHCIRSVFLSVSRSVCWWGLC